MSPTPDWLNARVRNARGQLGTVTALAPINDAVRIRWDHGGRQTWFMTRSLQRVEGGSMPANRIEDLARALALAILADTEERKDRAVALADRLAAGMAAADVEQAKTLAQTLAGTGGE